jgi:hypothetical protein
LKAALILVYTVKDLARLRWKKRARWHGIHRTFKDSFKVPRAVRFRVPNHGENSPPKNVCRNQRRQANLWYYYDEARKADPTVWPCPKLLCHNPRGVVAHEAESMFDCVEVVWYKWS